MKPTPILIRNIPEKSLKDLQKKMPTASISLMVRALITHGIMMNSELFVELVNIQAEMESKAKGLAK